MKKSDVICFGGEDWWYHNRGHMDMQLIRCFARKGTTVYINSLVMQKPKLGRGGGFVRKLTRKTRSIFTGLKKSDAGFWVYSPFSLPLYHISWLRLLNERLVRPQIQHVIHKLRIKNPIIWVVCPTACDIAIKMKKCQLVYLRTDRYEEYPNVDREMIKKYDQRLKAAADLTIFANEALYKEDAEKCKKALYVDHGVDYEMFASAESNQEIPADMASVRKPIVGFFGGIDDHTFDIDFVKKVIDMLPQMSFVFVGKASSDCSALVAKKNVWMLGQKPYEQITHYGKCFDVAIMPWRQNRWIEACNPIKLKEYLALGKPVVSSPFPELQKYRDVVYQADTPQQFADCIKKAHSENNPELVAKRKQKVVQASWDSKAELVLHELFTEREANPRVVDQ